MEVKIYGYKPLGDPNVDPELDKHLQTTDSHLSAIEKIMLGNIMH